VKLFIEINPDGAIVRFGAPPDTRCSFSVQIIDQTIENLLMLAILTEYIHRVLIFEERFDLILLLDVKLIMTCLLTILNYRQDSRTEKFSPHLVIKCFLQALLHKAHPLYLLIHGINIFNINIDVVQKCLSKIY